MTPERNAPCPCGSGKKYKKCCLLREHEGMQLERVSPGAIQEATSFLIERHGEEARASLDRFVRRYLKGMDLHRLHHFLEEHPGLDEMFLGNGLSWVLVSGHRRRGLSPRMFRDLVLGPGGPLLDAEGRRWLEALVRTPMRLYEVVTSRPGEGMRLRDVFAGSEVEVTERSGSRSLRARDLVGTRVVVLDGHPTRLHSLLQIDRNSYLRLRERFAVRDSLHGEAVEIASDPAEDLAEPIWELWLRRCIPTAPSLVDRGSGEPVLLVTHHYQVLDWSLLEEALASASDCEGSREHSWTRFAPGEEKTGMRSSLLAINPSDRHDDRVELFARTQRMADDGKRWFEGLVGKAVRYITKEITDPRAMFDEAMTRPRSEGSEAGATPGAASRRAAAPQIAPEEMTAMLQEAYRSMYKDFADAPLPLFQNRTPREMSATPRGRREVEELIRTYEAGEQGRAEAEGRAPVSFAFLRAEIGLD